jgi:hypothetical protein
MESGAPAFLKLRIIAAAVLYSSLCVIGETAHAQDKPNILVIFGDDIGQSNVSAYSRGLMGYKTPNIDRIAAEGMMFTDYYAEQSCTAGRSSLITGQSTLRTGLSKVGIPAATVGLQKEDITIAEALKPLGYATGQFGKNHLGDRNEYLPTVHGFDEFFGNLCHLNAEEEPENPDYPPVVSSSIVSIRFLVSGPVSSHFCRPTLPKRGSSVASSVSVAEHLSTPRGPNLARNAGSFG